MDAIMMTEMWQAGTRSIATTTGAPLPAQAWRTPLLRHLKVASFIEGQESEDFEGMAQEQQHACGGKEGLHPLHVASSQGILKLGKALLDTRTVDPSVRDRAGRSPLHWAAMTDRVEFVQLLLERGARLDAVDHCNRTPLFSCAAFGARNAAQLLLQWGADIEACCTRGLTPLHAAASGGHKELVVLLLREGADRHLRTRCGATSRHVAERHGHTSIVQLLESFAGPKLSSFDANSGMQRNQARMAEHTFERHSLLCRTVASGSR